MKIDWEHIFLLGWHSADGMRHLTSWERSSLPWIDVVVLGATDNDMSHIMWSSPLHDNFGLILIPPLMNRQHYAKINNGLHAFGWYIDKGINRPPMRKLVDPWEWYDKLKQLKEK